MPQLELNDSELIVHLDKWEQILALHPSIRIPLAQVRGATEDSGFGGRSGMRPGWRLPGTHIPFLIAAGTFVKHGDSQFVYTRRKLQTIVIELAGNERTRLVIGVPNAHAQASRVNAAVARYQGLA